MSLGEGLRAGQHFETPGVSPEIQGHPFVAFLRQQDGKAGYISRLETGIVRPDKLYRAWFEVWDPKNWHAGTSHESIFPAAVTVREYYQEESSGFKLRATASFAAAGYWAPHVLSIVEGGREAHLDFGINLLGQKGNRFDFPLGRHQLDVEYDEQGNLSGIDYGTYGGIIRSFDVQRKLGADIAEIEEGVERKVEDPLFNNHITFRYRLSEDGSHIAVEQEDLIDGIATNEAVLVPTALDRTLITARLFDFYHGAVPFQAAPEFDANWSNLTHAELRELVGARITPKAA